MQVLPAGDSRRLDLIFPLIGLGLLSILAQVALLRELAVTFYGVELIYILGLGAWLMWTAAGASLGRCVRVFTPGLAAVLFLAVGWLLPAEVAFCRALRHLFGGVPGAYLPFARQMIGMSLALLPSGLLLGLLFPVAARMFIAGGRSLALAYAWESAGGLAGGLLATLFLKAGMQNFTVVLLCAAGCFLAAFVLSGARRVLSSASLLLAIGALFFSGPIDRAMTAWNHPALVETADTPYGRVSVEKQAGQISVFENDALSFDTEGTEAELFARTSALQLEHPSRILILGGGISGIVNESLLHHPVRLDYVELNGRMFRLVAPLLPAEARQGLESTQVHCHFADPRAFLLNTTSLYDLILVGMPDPASGLTNRFYTRDFFRMCAVRLGPGGVLAFRLHSAENYWSPLLAYRTAGIYRALREVLPAVVVLPGSTNLFLASNAPLSRDGLLPADRMRRSGIRPRLVSPPMILYLYSNDRFSETERLLAHATVPANTDARPICYQYSVLLWLSMFMDVSAIRSLDLVRPLYGVAGFLALIFWVARRRPSWRRSLLAGSAGLAGMALETVLILNYQTARGALFQDLGLLLMGFMLGLSAGALLVHRRVAAGRRLTAALGLLLLCAFAGLAGISGLSVSHQAAGLPVTCVLLALSGALVAALFAYAGLKGVDDGGAMSAAPVYAADLLGGCLASIFVSLVLIPSLGMQGTALAIAAVCGISLLLI